MQHLHLNYLNYLPKLLLIYERATCISANFWSLMVFWKTNYRIYSWLLFAPEWGKTHQPSLRAVCTPRLLFCARFSCASYLSVIFGQWIPRYVILINTSTDNWHDFRRSSSFEIISGQCTPNIHISQTSIDKGLQLLVTFQMSFPHSNLQRTLARIAPT